MARRVNAEGPTRQTLEATPTRVLTFLRGIGLSPQIRTILEGYGYTEEEHQRGWDLLHRVTGYKPAGAPGASAVAPADPAVRTAIQALDDWDEPGFARVRAALDRLHPEQARFVFANLQPATGAAAVLSVRTLLVRLDALEDAPEREATRTADRAALATRGIGPEERRRLGGLVLIAERGTQDAATTSAAQVTAAQSQEQRVADLRELRAWHMDWAATARSVITRRDYRIRLGLTRRRSPSTDDTPDAGTSDAGAPESAK